MKYLKTFELHSGLGIDTEIREILSDITDDDKFYIDIKSWNGARYKPVLDDNDFTVNIYEKEDKLFTWEEVKGPVQMLLDNLKDRYPIISVDLYLKGINGSIQLKKDDNDQLLFNTDDQKVIKKITCLFIR